MKFNRQTYMDKVKACWVAKNIGGTMGTPYENIHEMQDISGYNSPKGQPLGNDDLDLQLIWLCAVEERGIRAVTPQVLAEYWINFVPPHWNEYGIGKANLKQGLLPPFSGEYNNPKWKHSNGAWIRTELWACLFPGFPELAARYAYNDACVDHGLGEGTYAAMFVAALESAAFFENDIRKLIDTGLSLIPEDSRFAKCIKLAIELYDKGSDFKDARNALVESTSDLGWFQSPANVGFVVLGLLYGEGDFKKSMIHAINCGDDTDCTGATIGSIMGIMGGMEKVPEDWADYIGDEIVSCAIDLSYLPRARNCTELTQRVAELMPSAFKAYGMYTEYTDGDTELDSFEDSMKRIRDFDIPQTGLSCNLPDMIYAKGRVELSTLTAESGKEIELKVVFKNTMPDPKQLQVIISLPDGWSADKTTKNVYLHQLVDDVTSATSFKVIPGENVDSVNEILVRVKCTGRPTSVIMPITVFGE